MRFIDRLWQNLRYAIRGLRHSPGFTLAVVLSLALGIGANSTMFTIIQAVLLRPLPYPRPDQLISIGRSAKGDVQSTILEPDYDAWLASSHTLESVAAYTYESGTVGGGAEI